MQITNEFKVDLPASRVYPLLLDFDEVVPCVPGATLGETREDGARAVKVTVKLGPIRAIYDGTVQISEQEEAVRRAVLVASARELRGQGSARAVVSMGVHEDDTGSSVVSTVAEVDLTGRAAQMGSGIVGDVASRMMQDMARCLSARFAAPQPGLAAGPEPEGATTVSAGRMVLSVLLRRLARLFRRRR
jgi:carbon monoxide dehydrogenase subunit G